MRLIFGLLAFGLVAGNQESNHKDLAAKCGSEIEWHKSLSDGYGVASELKKPVLWYVPSISGGHMYNRGPLDPYMKVGVFTPPEIVDLVKRKFVAVRMESKGDHGIKATTYFEPCLVFLDGEKKLLHKIVSIRTINDDFFYNQMLLVLKKNQELNKPSTELEKAIKASESDKSAKTRLALAREYLADGDLAKAKEILEGLLKESKEEEAAIHYELARVNRLLRNGAEALKHVKEGKEKTKDASLKGNLITEEGLVHLKMEKLSEAKTCLEQVLKETAECTRAAEAKYYLGVIAIYNQDEKTAKDIWVSVAKDYKDSRWVWKAAANLTKSSSGKGKESKGVDSPLVQCFETVFWLDSIHYDTLAESTEWKRSEKDVAHVAHLAAKFLLRSQRSDGSWNDSRYAWMGPGVLPNVWMAITALCAAALLEHRDIDPKAIDNAVTKATGYLMNEKNMAKRGGNTESCYADGYRLLFFGKLLPTLTEKGEKDKVKDFMLQTAEELSKQQKGGFWSHEYSNAFSTGAIVHCIQIAKESGADIPQKLFESAGKALKGAKSSNGTYPYSTRGGDGWAAGRHAMCEIGLHFCGLTELSTVESAVEKQVKNLAPMMKVRKSDFHAGECRTGGFFFWHNYYPTTEAAKRVGKEEYVKKLRELLLTFCEIDGAFVDSHEMGRCYGTALGLLSLKNVTK